MDRSILWRRLDQPGHEAARLTPRGFLWHLEGTAVFSHEDQPCRLDYLIVCNSDWRTRSTRVSGWVGNREIEVDLAVDGGGRWQLNGRESAAVHGCIDVDLNFTPSTNLLPIRRLDLAIGEEEIVRAAWLRFPSFALERLEQRYRRADEHVYHYESGGGRFQAALTVNATGFVTHYPNFWRAETLA